MKALCLACAAILLFTTLAGATEKLVIDDFDYANDAAAQAAWAPNQGGQAVSMVPDPAGGADRVLRLPCDYTRPTERNYWDRQVQLDLSRFGRFEIRIYADDLRCLSHFSLFFQSQDGWYGTTLSLKSRGWQTLTLSRASFSPEDRPAGWNHITGIRLSPWKGGDVSSFFAVDYLRAYSEDIVIVFPANYTRGRGGEASTARQCASTMATILADGGVLTTVFDDTDVAAGALAGRKLAICAYNPNMPDDVVQALIDFVQGGGKIMVFYSLPPRLGEVLGITPGEYMAGTGDRFASLHFNTQLIPALPKEAIQASWNINHVEPIGPNTKVVATWYKGDGTTDNLPALTLNDAGVYMTHILLSDDPQAKTQMMLALVGDLVPSVWPDVAQRALAQLGQVASIDGIDALAAYVDQHAVGERKQQAQQLVLKARGLAEAAQRVYDNKRYDAVPAAVREVNDVTQQAYDLSHVSRPGEFRAVWCHSAFGIGDWGWDKCMKILADNGFNAVVPNMFWAGRAYYRSEVLPVMPEVAERGDQIALCVAAGKKYGVEVHPWKVNWNLGGAPEDFVAKLRAEGRLQADRQGNEVRWLCPSNPANFQLELDSMLEVVRNYDVDGIHFDYIRYPGSDSCYCAGCRQRFEEAAGVKVANWPDDVINGPNKDAFAKWRQDQITRLVRAVSEQARKIKPYIKISAAVFSNWEADRFSVGQDWKLWIQEGYLDFVCPMDYTDSPGSFDSLVRRQVEWVDGRVPIYPGVGVTLGTWTLTPAQTIDQIEIGRGLGADGFTLFNYSEVIASQIAPAMHESLTADKTTPPHDSPKVTFTFGPGVQGADTLTFGAAGIPISVTLAAEGPFRAKVVSAEAGIYLETIDGQRLRKVGDVASGGPPAQPDLKLEPGSYRLAVDGTVTLDDGTKLSFIRRSRPFAVSA
jgi:uncharacterized lipoprotein YddW (UPF0748 family)